MSKEFNFRRAWLELVQPAYEALSPAIKTLWEQVRVLSREGLLDQNMKTLGVDFPASQPELREAFEAIPTEELAQAACVLYHRGHWAYTEEGRSRSDAGACWKFEKLADSVTLARPERDNGNLWCSKTWRDKHWGKYGPRGEGRGLLQNFMEHEEGSKFDHDELAEKYEGLLPADMFKVHSVQICNHKPHPFMIGNQHIAAAQEHGGRLGEAVMREVPCAMRGCGLRYEDHTYDTILFLQLVRELQNPEAAQTLMTIKDEMTADKLDGLVFVDTPEHFRILPADPKPISGELL